MKRLLATFLVTVAVFMGSTAQARWSPRPGVTWQWQLQGNVDTRISAKVYNVDGFDTPKSLVSRLHRKDRRVICYISAGSWERWRPDANDFDRSLLGKKLDGWAGERWLDIRKVGALRDLMEPRVEMCARKDFDGIEFDNVDGYQNDSGFDLKGADQIAFNKMLARLAHREGLAAGLKNDLGQVAALEPHFDFAVNEQCFQYDECNRLRRFIDADKPVFHVEYEIPRSKFCDEAAALDFSSMRKRYSLKAWRKPC